MSETTQKKDITPKYLKELKEICENATQVVAWYDHNYRDQRFPGTEGTVRGPFGRWFGINGGDNGMGDPIKYPVPVAEFGHDLRFCAAAMNALPALLDFIEELQSNASHPVSQAGVQSDE